MPIKGEYVYHRKDGLWEARYVKEIDLSGKKKFGSVYAHSCKEAKEKRQEIVDNLKLYQRPSSLKNTTVSHLIEEWLAINKYRLKPSTFQRYKSIYELHIRPELGEMKVVYISTLDIQTFALGRQSSGLSAQSVNSMLVFLNTCLRYANRIYKLPSTEIAFLPVTKKEMRVFSREEQRKLVEYLLKDIDIYKFGILLTLYTGLRVGELCALKWEDVDDNCVKITKTMLRLQSEKKGETKLITGPPKSLTSVRTIPIPSFLIETTSMFRKGKAANGYLLGTKDRPVAEPRIMQYRFKKILQEIGIQDATFHTLRHTFATRGVEYGFDVKSLSEIMGHAGVQTTLNLYVHSSLEQKRSNMELLRLIP